jgi:uncharacterized repeat protein (TIGR01451 family)
MKNKSESKTLIILCIFFIITIGLIFSITSKNVLAESNQNTQKVDPNSYFSWKNDWQKNERIIIGSENIYKDIEGNYPLDITRTVTFNLLEGDTKPRIHHNADTFSLHTPVHAIDWPVFNGVNSNQEYKYTNFLYWKNLPTNSEGEFKSTINNWPGVAHWEGWPIAAVKSTAYVMQPIQLPGGPEIPKTPMVNYTFSNDVPNNPSYTVHTQVDIDDSYEKPVGYPSKNFAIGYGVRIPQLVKAVFKDIDNPDAPSLSEDVILGMHGEMADSIKVQNKAIDGYNFVSSQIVLGPTFRGDSFTGGTYLPENFSYNDASSSIKNPTPDESWSTTLDTQQKGVIFWYKKKIPNISLTKQVNKTEAFVGETLTYNINTVNNGDADLVNGKIIDKIPNGLGKPSNIKLDNDILLENQENDGKYYTWNSSTNELTVFIGNLKVNENKNLTYDTTINNGTSGETKTNHAELSGDNSNQTPSGTATVTIKEKIINLDIEDITASTGDNDISVISTISAATEDTHLVNGTLTIKYPQDNLSLGDMKIIQNGKDITSGTTIDKSVKNIVKIKGINADNIKKYPVTVQFNKSSALIEIDKTSFMADIQSENLSATTDYNVEIKEGILQLLWVPDVLDFGEYNLEELNKNEFETTTKLPVYIVVSDMRSKNDTREWRVEATSSDLFGTDSNVKITDLSYMMGDNKLKEYTSDDDTVPPSESTIGLPPESWNNYVQVKSSITVQNDVLPSSNIISAKKGTETGKYAIEVNQSKLILNNLKQITEKNYNGTITWTLIDSL